MSNPMQDLHALGLNPFAVVLLAESMLKSAYVKHKGTEPLTFEFPVRRGDCAGWAGVRITIEAVREVGAPAPAHDCCPKCGNDDNDTDEDGTRECLECGNTWKRPS